MPGACYQRLPEHGLQNLNVSVGLDDGSRTVEYFCFRFENDDSEYGGFTHKYTFLTRGCLNTSVVKRTVDQISP